MSQTAQLTSPPATMLAVTGLSIAEVAATAPAQDDMIALVGYKSLPGPLYLDILIVGSEATADLTGAHWYGWDDALDLPVDLGPVRGGAVLVVSSTYAIADTLSIVAGVYTHIGIGRGTLSAGEIDLHPRTIEVH